MKNYQETINKVVRHIMRQAVTQSKSRSITISEETTGVDTDDIYEILLKLKDDFVVISSFTLPSWFHPGGPMTMEFYGKNDFEISLEPELFNKWATNYLAEKEYESKLFGVKEKKNQILFWVDDYTEAREVVLNKRFIIAKPALGSENDNFFLYISKNPNIEISISEIDKVLTGRIKDFHKIIDNLGFKNDLKRLFFHVSKNHIMFINPVTRKRAEELNIFKVRLSK